MNGDDVTAEHAPSNEAERVALERRWYEGELWRHYVHLLTFLDRHRHELQTSGRDFSTPDTVLAKVKRLLAETGSIHHSTEMRDQLAEIRREIWIQGEHGFYDREQIAREWAAQHAANFRRWRLKEYVFVVDRCAPDILAHLTAQGIPPADIRREA